MKDLTNPIAIYTKAALFVLMGIIACTIILLENPSLKITILLTIAIWSFARAYYFVFYVIEHYVDSTYKFAGLWSFCQHLYNKRKRPEQ